MTKLHRNGEEINSYQVPDVRDNRKCRGVDDDKEYLYGGEKPSFLVLILYNSYIRCIHGETG